LGHPAVNAAVVLDKEVADDVQAMRCAFHTVSAAAETRAERSRDFFPWHGGAMICFVVSAPTLDQLELPVWNKHSIVPRGDVVRQYSHVLDLLL
jgi:hypothetical protein